MLGGITQQDDGLVPLTCMAPYIVDGSRMLGGITRLQDDGLVPSGDIHGSIHC